MSDMPLHDDRILELAEAVCVKNASENELVELDSMLFSDEDACRCYLDYCRMHVALKLELRANQAGTKSMP